MEIPETEIIISRDGAEILRKTVRPGDYVIGRDDECDVCVEADLVSRRHAHLTINFDHALIEDMGSRNGTFVNGKVVTGQTRLWPNQKIGIGSATIELRRLKTIPKPDASFAPTTAAVKRLLPEDLLSLRRYEIGGVVAQGGMGAILDAREAAIDRTVAMKVMLDGWSPDDLARFVAEARITGQLEHPNIVPVHELGVDANGQAFYTMKFVQGITLKKVLELLAHGYPETVRKYSLAVLLTVFQKVCDAIAFAHSRGVIHRDIKPENIMIGKYGEVLLMDWGLSKVLGDDADADVPNPIARPVSDSVGFGSTMVGATIGTAHYMAPEQARSELDLIDARSDIYALGATLYHILALRRSVSGENPDKIVKKVGRGQIDPLIGKQGPDAPLLSHLPGGRIPESLAAVVRKAMAFDQDRRYASVEALQADIAAYQNGFATRAERAGVGKQLLLLIRRNKGVFATAFAAWFLITALALWFVINLRASERVAVVERNDADQQRIRAELARTDAESERNVAQQATIAADVQRNIAQQALADTEIERNKAQKALADYESEHSRADQAVADVKSESSRAEQAAAGLQTESERAEQGAAAAKAESERAAQEAADLINAAPDIFAAARTLLSRGDINAALEKIGMAIKLDETNPDYRLLRANLLETTQDLAGATDEYRRVLALRPDDPTATANLDLCGQLLDAKGDDPALNLDLRKQLLAALRNQNRTDEAAFLSNQIDPLGVATRKEILKRLKNFTILPNWKDTDLVRASDGTFSINFSGLNLAGIAGLKLDGLPISRINMGGSQGSDLTPLKNLKLNSLILENCQQVSDISPLRGQPLKSIELCGTMVRDLSPLMDSPTLEEIGLPNVPLKSMPPEVLKWLEHLPHLKRISYGYDNNHASQSATEFWQSQGITP